MTPRAVVLYDRDCGFCRWSVAKVLALDVHRRLRPVAIQDREGQKLLAALEPPLRLRSAHVVTPDGAIHSAGAVAAPILRMLPGGRLMGRLVQRLPRVADGAYAAMAGRRGGIGRLIPRRAIDRASARIATRA